MEIKFLGFKRGKLTPGFHGFGADSGCGQLPLGSLGAGRVCSGGLDGSMFFPPFPYQRS